MKKGFTAGTFDLCHAGHVLTFKECRENCDYLIVGLQTNPHMDASNPEVNRSTKNIPVMSVKERKIILSGIKYIDEIVVYNNEKELYEFLKKNEPAIDVRFIGADWKNKLFTGHDLPIEIFFNKRDHGYSSSELRKRIYEVEKIKAQKKEPC